MDNSGPADLSWLAGGASGARQPVPVAARARPAYAVAVDIGGTKIAAGAVTRTGELTRRVTAPTPRDEPGALLAAVAGLVREVMRAASGPEAGTGAAACAGVGVAVAGAVDPDSGDVHYAPNIPALRETPLRRLISEDVGLPVVVGFDGHLTALGEHRVGAGRGTRNMVLLTVGTGIGGGLILDGRLYRGSDNLAGAAGWMIADPARLGPAGSRLAGNLESISAGPAIAGAGRVNSGGGGRAYQATSAEDIVAAARVGDEDARAVLTEAGRTLGYAVTSIVSLLNPEKVIIGGGLGSTGIFLAPVRAAVAVFAQPTSRSRVVIETAALGADAALVGAACAVFEAREERTA
jgi:glucokinase